MIALLLASLILAADPPKPPEPTKTVEQQLANAKAENASLREYITRLQAWDEKRAATLQGAVTACLGNAPAPVPEKPKDEPAK